MRMDKIVAYGCLLLAGQAGAQIVAGEVPTGHTLTDYAIHLEAIAMYTEASAWIDVDCDGVNDFRILLQRNWPEVDDSNRLYLRSLSGSITVCAADTTPPLCSFNHAYQYPDGQTMSCPLPFSMLADTNIWLGDYLTFTCQGTIPDRADSAYIHYAKEVDGVLNEGWILLSFDVRGFDGGPNNPWADVHAAIGVCQGTGIGPYGWNDERTKLYPNPAPDGLVNWSCPVPLLSIEVHDAMGRLVLAGAGGTTGQLDLSGRQGAFFLRCRTIHGPLPVEKLVVY